MGNVINEAVIHTRSVSKMMHYELYVDDVFVNTYKGDGVLVATPTGSTAYAISVGGPLLDPRVNAILVAPIATFKLASRPFLVPIESKIKVKLIEPYRDTTLVLDGQVEHILSAGAEIELMRARSTAKFIRFTHDNFYSRLREKLM
jgi:NAD+ kinase